MVPTIIAECSTNHGGERRHMATMIHDAASAGADFAKFQSYSVKHLSPADPQYDWMRRCELSNDDHKFIQDECEKHKIGFMTTVFSPDRVKFLASLKLKAIKIGSGEAMNNKLLRAVSKHEWSAFVSTGLLTEGELSDIYVELSVPYVLMHTVSKYPTATEEAALTRMAWLREIDCRVGYSDHTIGMTAAMTACAMGAEAIEVHMQGPARMTLWDKSTREVAHLAAFARESAVMRHWDSTVSLPEPRPYVGRWNYRG